MVDVVKTYKHNVVKYYSFRACKAFFYVSPHQSLMFFFSFKYSVSETFIICE